MLMKEMIHMADNLRSLLKDFGESAHELITFFNEEGERIKPSDNQKYDVDGKLNDMIIEIVKDDIEYELYLHKKDMCFAKYFKHELVEAIHFYRPEKEYNEEIKHFYISKKGYYSKGDLIKYEADIKDKYRRVYMFINDILELLLDNENNSRADMVTQNKKFHIVRNILGNILKGE